MAKDEPIISGVAGRYASALYELATEQRALQAVEGDLKNIQTLLDQSPDFGRMMRSPVISSDEQAKALKAVLTKAGVSQLTQNFFGLLAKNRRLFAAGDMISAFQAISAKARGETTAEVTSAMPLTDAQLSELKATLKASQGKDVQLSTKVDPSLLGGLIVKIGSRMIDNSIRTKLQGMKIALKGTS